MSSGAATSPLPIVLFLVGVSTVIVGAAWGVWWQARHWDADFFSVARVPGQIRLSYGMSLGAKTLLVFGFATLVASVVLLATAARGRTVGAAAEIFAMVLVGAITLGAVSLIRARSRSGKDDLVIDLQRQRLMIPAAARPDAKARELEIEGIETLAVEIVPTSSGTKAKTLDNRVVARCRGSSAAIVVADSLAVTTALGMAGELGRLLKEASPRHDVSVDDTPHRASAPPSL